MTNILLAKPVLKAEEVDLSVGESNITRLNLFRHFPQLCNSNILTLNQELTVTDLEYQDPAGYKPLVEYLEAKHKTRVVITNGAKQALAAVFYALKKLEYSGICLQPIHWALLPPMIKTAGLGCAFREPTDPIAQEMAYLLVAPSNPDNWCPKYSELQQINDAFVASNSPLIFDGAYYTHSYLPEDYELGPIGDVQIYSCSKMLGLSAARVGYAVIPNEEFYKLMIEYIEMDTVGVSIFSQKFVYSVFQEMDKNPEDTKKFEKANFQELKEAKTILKSVSDKILEVPKDIEEQPGMFSWLKLKNKEAFEKAKIHIVSGEHFGDASMVRLNLGIGNDVLKKCITKLNEAI